NHTSLGLVSGREGSVRGFAEFHGHERVARTWADLGETLRSGKNAFERTHGQSLWGWLAGDDGVRAAFFEGMSANSQMVAPAAALPCRGVGKLCAVGGGLGAVIVEALRRHDHLRGVLFDGEYMIREARPLLEAAGVSHRVELVAGNFLEEVPRGSDAYLIKT